MSFAGKLGTYVHLFRSNYNKWHDRPIGDSSGVTLGEAIVLQNNHMAAKLSALTIKNKSLDTLEKRLQLIAPKNAGKDLSVIGGIDTDRASEVIEILKEKSSTSAINDYISNSEIVMGYNQRAEGGMATQKVVSVTTAIRNKLRSMKYNIEKINKAVGDPSQEKLIADLETKLQSIENQEQFLVKVGAISPIIANSPIDHYTKLQAAIKEVKWLTVKSAIVGEFGELLVASCGDTAIKVANDELKNVLKNTILGGESFDIEYDNKLFAVDMRGEFTNKAGKPLKKKDENSTVAIALSSKQGKVDVDIMVDEENIAASVKNYSSTSFERKGGFSLQETLNLMDVLLNTEQQGHFANHWLNLHTNQYSVNARDTFKREVAYTALSSGNPMQIGKQKPVNTFVMMNYETGQILVKSAKTMIENELNSFIIKPDENALDPDYRSYNQKAPTIEARLTKVLNILHQTKIDVLYKSSQFDS